MHWLPQEISLLINRSEGEKQMWHVGSWRFLAAGRSSVAYVCEDKVEKLQSLEEGVQNRQELELARECSALQSMLPRCYGLSTRGIAHVGEFDALVVERVAFTVEQLLNCLHKLTPNRHTVSMVVFTCVYSPMKTVCELVHGKKF